MSTQRSLIGTSLDQVSTNAMLGTLAFQDANGAYIETVRGAVALEGLSKDITDTAVDVFVYDTRKDSDGGAWRKRTQHTSWYNETLNTATRGSRREFPAVAVIVLEAYTLTIYDGDDPDLPMWMVFNATTQSWNSLATWLSLAYEEVSRPMSAASALNSKLVVTSSEYGVVIIDFIDESHIQRGRVDLGSGIYALRHKRSGSIALRNDTSGQYVTNITGLIVNRFVNDVAMTVLPNAPIDPSTGLPIPTIAVATNGGVSVIKDDGSVVDIAGGGQVGSSVDEISFYNDSQFIVTWNTVAGGTRNTYSYNIPSSDVTANASPIGRYVDSTTASGTQLYYSRDAARTFKTVGMKSLDRNRFILVPNSFNPSLVFVDEDQTPGTLGANGMVAYVTSSYNSGWQQGRIKGAFLSDTSTASVTGSELITNGTFDTDTTGWSAHPDYTNTTLSIDSNRLKVQGGGAQQVFSTIVGRRYVVTYTLTQFNDGGIYLGTQPSGANSYSYFTTGAQSSGTYTYYFTAVSTTAYITLFAWNAGTTYAFYDNVSARLEEELDRSVNNKGLQVFGTITKTPVAPGADLVAYSGFSANNYLRQPYNSSLDFGTGDFSVMFWAKVSSSSDFHPFLSKLSGADNSGIGWNISKSSDNTLYLYTRNLTNISSTPTLGYPVNIETWALYCFTRSSNGTINRYDNGSLVVSTSATVRNISSVPSDLLVGEIFNFTQGDNTSSIALVRISGSIPSPEQIKKIYEDEKVLFQEGAQATLYGTSDAVTALAYDETTDLLHVGTSSGRSDFSGLKRINNTTTAVTTAISASNGLIAEQ